MEMKHARNSSSSQTVNQYSRKVTTIKDYLLFSEHSLNYNNDNKNFLLDSHC